MTFKYKPYVFIILCFFSSVSGTSVSGTSVSLADDRFINELEQRFQSLGVSASSTSTILQNQAQDPAHFVVNVIAYVPAPNDFSYDSPDEEDDGSFSPDLFSFDASDEKTFPFRTITVKKKKKNQDNEEDIFVVKRKIGVLHENDLQEADRKSIHPSQIVHPFLRKLEIGAFEEQDKHKFFDTVRVVMGLNRPASLSTRQNSALRRELDASSCDLPNYCHRFAFFWIPQWFDCNNKAVEYNRVKKFYKQLKRKNPHSATKFREVNEKHPLIPYQGLRERVKNHNATKTFARQLRSISPLCPLYLSIVDSDTVDFNGVYSAYLRLVKNHSGQNPGHPVTAMTTGYIFQGSGDEGSYPFKIASELDRNIRIAITHHIPLGVYYPEPNLCILIPNGQTTVPESFIDKTVTVQGTCESPALLKKVKNRPGSVFVFSGDRPLITTIPPRARLTKASKTPISFSPEFSQGASPTEKDIISLKQISQSHFHEDVLFTNLYINRPFTMTDPSFYHFKKLLSALRKSPTPENDRALKKFVDAPTALSIGRAFQDVNKLIIDFTAHNKRTLNEQDIIDYLSENEIDVALVGHEKIQIFSDEDIKNLITHENEVLDINELIEAPAQTLRDILYAESVCESLEEERISFKDLLRLHELCPQDFSDFFEKFLEFQYESGEDIDEFIRLYEENPLHIDCMVGDPVDMALEIAPDVDDLILSYLEPEDIAWIRDQLCESEQMIFNSNLGFEQHDDEDDDYANEEYDDEESVDLNDFDTEYDEYYRRAYSSDQDEDELP